MRTRLGTLGRRCPSSFSISCVLAFSVIGGGIGRADMIAGLLLRLRFSAGRSSQAQVRDNQGGIRTLQKVTK